MRGDGVGPQGRLKVKKSGGRGSRRAEASRSLALPYDTEDVMTKAHDDAVWITGLGLATPVGASFREFGANLLAGKSGIQAIDVFETKDHVCKIGGFLEPLTCPSDWD